MPECIIKDFKREYIGNYVAIPSLKERVIAYGQDPGKVQEEARKKGCENPIVFYVQDPKYLVGFALQQSDNIERKVA